MPGNNGFYLKQIVGDLNLTLPTAELKRKYKEDYEKWKLHCTFAILGRLFGLLTKTICAFTPNYQYFLVDTNIETNVLDFNRSP